MSIIICPSCKATGKLPGGSEGRRFRCPKCGEAVSIKAEGFADTTLGLDEPNVQDGKVSRSRKPPKKIPTWLWILIIVGGIMATGIAGAGMLVVLHTIEASTQKQIVEADLGELLANWKKNPVAVIDQYGKSVIQVTGYMKSIDSNIHHEVYVKIYEKPDGGFGDEHLTVYFLSKPLLAKLKDHSVGSKITLQVTISGVDSALRSTAYNVIP